MVKAKALLTGIAARAVTPAKAKASASTVTPPSSGEDITKSKLFPRATASAEAQKRKRISGTSASSGSPSRVEIDMDDPRKAGRKLARIHEDLEEDGTFRLWSQ